MFVILITARLKPKKYNYAIETRFESHGSIDSDI